MEGNSQKMSRRRLRIVSSDDEETPPPPPPLQQQNEEDIDEDIILDEIETDFQTVTLNSANPTPNTNSSTTNTRRDGSRINVEPIPLDISDEEIEEDTMIGNHDVHFGGSESPVNGILEMLGLKLKRVWLDSCLRGLQTTFPGFQGMDDSTKAKLCLQQFLVSDMNYNGAGVLPPNVHMLHMVDLKGPFVLQVDEVVNISCPLRGRYQSSAPGVKRCLKLSMTDGVQRVFGMEYRPIKDLESLAPAGLKVAICNVNVRRGIMMLVPEVLQVLGGSVEELDAARQRLITEINKPPRGKRNRTGIVPPLATRATLAAWPPRNASVQEDVDQATRSNAAPAQANVQHQETAPVNDRQKHTSSSRGVNNPSLIPPSHEHVEEAPNHSDRPVFRGGGGTGTPVSHLHEDFQFPTNISRPTFQGGDSVSVPRPHQHEVPAHFDRPAFQGGRGNTPSVPRPHQHEVPAHFDRPAFQGGRGNTPSVPCPRENVEVPMHFDRPAFRRGGDNASSFPPHGSASTNSEAAVQGTVSVISSNDTHRQVSSVSASGNDAGPFMFSARKPQDFTGNGTVAGSSSNERPRQDSGLSGQKRQERASISSQDINFRTPVRASGQKTLPGMFANFMENVTVPAGRDSTEPSSSDAVDMDVEEVSLVNGLGHALLAGDKETPFTYLASLSAKLAVTEDHDSVVRGKIKCFVTSVKGFLFKEKPRYELNVYVDDGSLISEILIDHKVVQNIIGYSSQEATQALADPEMQKIFVQFQLFLTTFEGTMVIEMKRTSKIPVAIEMNQGCPTNDALLLLKRLKSYTSPPAQNPCRNPIINLSP